jgi:hypothetical protein
MLKARWTEKKCLIDMVGWISWFMVFNATFNNISVISWRSVLLVEETLSVHSVSITSKLVSSNPIHGEVYLM